MNTLRNNNGGTQASIASIIGGVLTIVVGFVLANTVVTQAASVPTQIGSFAGASSLNDLVPLVY